MNINTTGRVPQTPLSPLPQGTRVHPAREKVPANYAIHRLNQPTTQPQPVDQSTVKTALRQTGGLENPGMVSFPNVSPEALAKDVSQTPPHIRRVQRIPTVQHLSHGRPTALGSDPDRGGVSAVSTRAVTAKVPMQKVSDAQAEKMGEHYKKKLNDRMKAADPKSDVGQYYRTTQLLQEYAYYKQTGKGPLADDPQARELIEANLKFLQQKARGLAKSPAVKKMFSDVRAESIRATFGAQAGTVAKQYANYILSDAFAAELKQMSPEDRKAALAQASVKLAALDPALAKATVRQLAEQQLQTQKELLAQNLNKRGPEGDKARAALEASLREQLQGSFGNTQDAVDKINKLVEQLMTAFKENPSLLLTKEGMTEALQETAKAFKNMKDMPAHLQADMQQAVKGLSGTNVLGSALSLAALVNGALVLGNAKSAEEVLKGLGGVVSGVSGLGAVGKALNLADAAVLGKLAHLGALGPIGDALGVAADVVGFMQEGVNEDEIGRFLKGISAATGAAATLAGAAVLLGCSGPLAPIVLAGAAAAGLAISAADAVFSESDKTGEVRQVLRDTGLSAKQDVVKAEFEKVSGFIDDYEAMQKQFRKQPDVEGKLRYINQILDNKDPLLNPSRMKAVFNMLNSLSGQELEALLDKGLHLGVVGRKMGSNPAIVRGLLQKLEWVKDPVGRQARAALLDGVARGGHSAAALEFLKKCSPQELDTFLKSGTNFEDWGRGLGADPKAARQVVDLLMAANTPASRKALAAFLKGMIKGGHDQALQTLLQPKETGQKILAQLSAEDLKGLVEETQDLQLTQKLLELSSWDQFNTLMEAPDARDFLATLRSRFMDTKAVGFLGTVAAWGESSKATPKTRDRLRSWFDDSQKNHNLREQNYGRSADAYVKGLTDAQLKDLSSELKARLKSAADVASSHYVTDETRKRLKAAGIIQ